MDENSGLAASGDVLAISGHFAGNLSAHMSDDTISTILNSNTAPGELPDADDQFHPNAKSAAGHTGVDDGFVIKASASTGKADWIKHYPQSNSDAQVVGVDVDAAGNVYGSGYSCETTGDDAAKVCTGFIAKFAASDGALVWESKFDEIGATLWLKYDASDNAIYFTATTAYGGKEKSEVLKAHPNCEHDTCAVTGRLSATDGAMHWVRTFQASPRWGVFDQSGDVELAVDADGPYIYAAFDDAGESGGVSLDAGTPYAGCKAADGTVTPEYEISTTKRISSGDCPGGTTFVAQDDADAVPAAAAKTHVLCGDKSAGDACIVKYHKYTGLPVWARDAPMVAGLAPMPDGKGLAVTGWYYYGWAESGRTFGSRVLPGYLRVDGLGSQAWGIYNAKLTTAHGDGAYVLHSGGGKDDRIYDLAIDSDGNVYNVGYMKNRVMNWGGPGGLQTKLVETGGEAVADTGTAPEMSEESHMFVAKLAAATESVPSCLDTCSGTTDTATVKAGFCFIDGVCYAADATAEAFGKACHQCTPATSQTAWSPAASLGTTHCFIDDICWEDGDFAFTQRRTHSPKVYSTCEHCSAAANAEAWSLKAGYELVDGVCSQVSPPPPPHTATYTDGDGNTHVWHATKPKIVTGAFQALTLIDMGVDPAQIIGTFGERATSGSNVDGVYANYNIADHGDHAAAPYDPSHFLTDPSPAEKALLANMYDVSPTCSGTNGYCSAFDVTIMDANGWPDVIIAGPLFEAWIIENKPEVLAGAAARGVPIIILEDQTTSKLWKSFVEIAEDFETLAKALGADTKAATANDKAAFCENAANFKAVASAAQGRGVRALAGVIPYGNAVDGNIGGWLQTPDRNPALTMLEALGMQILHTEIGYGGDYYEAHFSAGWPAYNGSMSATDLKSSSGTYDYAVDFFLYDPRTALDIVSDAFAAAWPHPAIVAKQYAPYPITTLHYSYGHAAKILESVGAKLAAAAKVDPAATTCTVVTDVEGEHYRTTGLAPGEYACATPIEYDWCGTDLGGAVGAPWCESGHELVDGVCSQVSPPPPPHTATYTDGDGNTHVWHATKPKIVTGAFQALTLIDMGVDPAQIIGTFGERATSGSNVDGVYANYNIADHGDHAAAPYDPSHFLTDPSPAEKALLANMYDVSPTCSGTNGYCSAFDVTIMDANGWPDVIIAGPLFEAWIIENKPEVLAGAAARGVPIIILEDQTTSKLWKSFVEIAEDFETLAKALGADTKAATANDKAAFCENAANFKAVASAAQGRGVRALAGVIPYGNAVDGNIGGWLQTPDRNPALTMLEALGMQILHTEIGYGGDYYEAHFSAGWPAYNGSMSATDLKSSSGTYDYAVDFFLYDPRTALDIVSDAFAAAWPHPAIVAKQYAPYPITTLHYSYGHAAKILESVGAKLAAAAKVDPAATTCTVVTDVEGEHYRTTGLAPGEYACATPIEYDWCVAQVVNASLAYAAGAASVTPEDGVSQADVDAAYAAGAASVTPEDGVTQADVNAAQATGFDQGAKSVTPEDGVTQADVDAAAAAARKEGADSVTPDDGVTQADVDAAQNVESNNLGGGALAGIAVACAVVGLVVGAVGSLACRKPASQKSPPEVRTPDVSASGIKSAV